MNDVSTRTIETVTAEIVTIRNTAQRILLSAAVEIGRRLKEAKELLPHGQWGEWLTEKVDFSQKTAERYMKLFDEYADRQTSLFGAETNSTTMSNLSVSNALRLLAVPEEERESFAKENDVEHKTSREMDELMARLKEEKEGRDKAERHLAELLSRPVEVAVQRPTEEEMQELVREAVQTETEAAKEERDKAIARAEKIEAEMKELRRCAEQDEKENKQFSEKINSQNEELKKLKIEIAKGSGALKAENEELKKKLAMSDAAVTRFKTLFETVQGDFSKLMTALEQVDDETTRGKLREAIKKLLSMWEESV